MKPGYIQLLTQGATFSTWMYVVVYAKNIGISDTGIATVAATFAIATFFSNYLFGRASDNYGRRVFLLSGLAVSSVTFLIQILMYDFWSYLGYRILTGVSMGIFPAALVAYVHETKGKLGNFSSYGAVGWIIGMVISGIISEYIDIRTVFILSSLMFMIAFLYALRLPEIEHTPIEVPLFPKRLLKKNLAIYTGVLIRHSGASLLWVFWPLFLQSLGANLLWIGIIIAINASSQAAVMYYIVDKIDCKRSIHIGLFLSGITFVTFALAQNHWQILPTQILLGASFAFMYVGALIYLNKFNIERGTATGILGSTLNISSIIGSTFAIFLIAIFGEYRWIIVFSAIIAFTSFGIYSVLIKNDSNECIEEG